MSRYICRTGSKEFNIHLCNVAKDLGFHWNPYEGLRDQKGAIIKTDTEQEFFSALALEWVMPVNRER